MNASKAAPLRSAYVVVALASLAIAACGKSEAKKREEILSCSTSSLDARGISACLVAMYRWKEAEAAVAGRARQRVVDSIARFQRDSLWGLDAARHREQLAKCAGQGGDVARCLGDNFAWDAERAGATFDSVWRAEAPQHHGQIQRCALQRKSSAGSCLMLYYKWDPKHALALDDSLVRAKIRAQNTR